MRSPIDLARELAAQPALWRPWFHLAGAGESIAFGPRVVHRVRHVGGPPAVTIHVAGAGRAPGEPDDARKRPRRTPSALPAAA